MAPVSSRDVTSAPGWGSCRSRSQRAIVRSSERSRNAAISTCGRCSSRPRTSSWHGGRARRCSVYGPGSSKSTSAGTSAFGVEFHDGARQLCSQSRFPSILRLRRKQSSRTNQGRVKHKSRAWKSNSPQLSACPAPRRDTATRRRFAGAEGAQFCIEFGREHDREEHHTPVLPAAWKGLEGGPVAGHRRNITELFPLHLIIIDRAAPDLA